MNTEYIIKVYNEHKCAKCPALVGTHESVPTCIKCKRKFCTKCTEYDSDFNNGDLEIFRIDDDVYCTDCTEPYCENDLCMEKTCYYKKCNICNLVLCVDDERGCYYNQYGNHKCHNPTC